jgi:hypothetical protein
MVRRNRHLQRRAVATSGVPPRFYVHYPFPDNPAYGINPAPGHPPTFI